MRWVLFFAILAITMCSQYIPIPHNEHGLTIGSRSSNLHIQAFYDLLCSDSKDANEVLLNVIETVGLQRFQLSYIFVPLPYHLYSFKVHQLYQYIAQQYGDIKALEYIIFILKNQASFMESKWRNYRITDFEFSLARSVSQNLKLEIGQLIRALRPRSSHDIKTRAEWKFATGSLSVSGTPIFFANGVKIDGAQSWEEEQWVNFIIEHS